MEKILVLETRYLHTLGAVRTVPHLMIALDGDWVWLKGIPVDGGDDIRFSSLPALNTYLTDQSELLFAPAGKTPIARLKKMTWLPLNTFITVALPVSAMPAILTSRLDVKLSRSGSLREPCALITGLAEWKAYADQAPGIRLRQLQFAVSDSGRVLIMGSPLPPVKGVLYWQNKQVLLPAGFDFDPPVLIDLVVERMGPGNQEFILFDQQGNWEAVPLSGFRPAKRSAVRLTKI